MFTEGQQQTVLVLRQIVLALRQTVFGCRQIVEALQQIVFSLVQTLLSFQQRAENSFCLETPYFCHQPTALVVILSY